MRFWYVERGWQIVYNRIEQRLNTFVLERRADDYREKFQSDR